MTIRYVLPVLLIVFLLAAVVMIKTNKPVIPAEKSIKLKDSVVKTDRIPLRAAYPRDSLSPLPDQHVFVQQEEHSESPQATMTTKPATDQSAYSSEMKKTSAIISRLKPGGLTTGSYQAISIPAGKQGYTLHINNDQVTTIFLSDSLTTKDSINLKK
mgnify:FL=1